MRIPILGSLVLSVALAATSARAQEDFETARQAYMAGEQFFSAGQYPEAITSFQQSYDLVPYPDTMFNIAACYEAIGAYEEARVRYDALARTPDVDPEMQAQSAEGARRMTALLQPGPDVGPGPTPTPTSPPALTARTSVSLWDALDDERPHEGPGFYVGAGAGGPLTSSDRGSGSVGYAIQAGLLYRLLPNLSLDIEALYAGFGWERSYTDAAGAAATESATTGYLDILVGARYHILGSGFWDPWVGAGVGYAWWGGGIDPWNGSDGYVSGAAVRASAGLDMFITNFIALGVRFDARIPIFLQGCVQDGSCSGFPLTLTPAGNEIDRGDLPFIWQFGINATFYFLRV
jgi:outer membrane protein W